MKKHYYIPMLLLFFSGCTESAQKEEKLKLVVLDPGHFHAALVHKSTYADLDSNVLVYAPDGKEVESYENLVAQYNAREDQPTNWNLQVYKGADYVEKMGENEDGDIVMLAGNNRHKADYINRAVSAGKHVLSDKPMAIDHEGFLQLEKTFREAKGKGLFVYDMMTERYEITNRLQKALLHDADLFGELEKGTLSVPAIEKESVHHFYKQVSGKPLVRPAWYFDVAQQGDGMVDVTTHLIDLIQWTGFPETLFDYNKDLNLIETKRWPTLLDKEQFYATTQTSSVPDYLQKDLQGEKLAIYANGEILYSLKDTHVKVRVVWNHQAPEGTGDTHYSIMRGTQADLVVRQGEAQGYKPVLYIEAKEGQDQDQFEKNVQASIDRLQSQYSGVSVLKESPGVFAVVIPDELRSDHESHFSQVVQKYLSFIKKGKMPEWEESNMLIKYYLTTKALEQAKLK